MAKPERVARGDIVGRVVTALAFGLLVIAGTGTAAETEKGLPRVVLATELGDIVLEVDTSRAPVSAGNFLRYVDAGYYDGASFYRTVTLENDNGAPKIEVIQGGLGNGVEPPFPPIDHESTDQTGLRHTDGAVSMARGAAGTATSEFFICIGDQPGLDHGATRNADGLGFAAFGRVVEGMEVVHQIHQRPADGPTEDAYVKGQMIEAPVTIRTARRLPNGG
jgi:peptidyl-prolyl cis-trans isomerase A (cyclophilin A)